jgi:hypothetical protein
MKTPKQTLIDAVGDSEQVLCYIPGYDPSGLDIALEWLERSTRENYLTDFRVAHDEDGAKVWLKRWSIDDDDEPDWPEEWSDAEDND